jgi:hypothetical protein
VRSIAWDYAFWWGFMSREGPEGRARSSILVQLGASAGVLVLPPLMLSAGVALFGSQTEDRLQIAADQTLASAVSKSSALIPLSPRPREISKNADRPPLQTEPAVSAVPVSPPALTAAAAAPAAAAPADTETVIEFDEPIKETERDAAAEPVPFLGPVPVTLVVVRKEPEPEPEADEPEETPAPAEPAAAVAPAITSHEAPKAPSLHPAHPRIKAEREEARAPRRLAEKRPHAPAAHAPAAHAPAAPPRHVTASAAPKAKPKLQHRADLEN